jgi:hypothetical protein
MQALEKRLSVEFEQYPATDFSADEIRQHRGKTVLDAVRDMLARRYPDVGRQMASGGRYDIELCAHRDDTPCETPVRTDARWDDIAEQCENQRLSLAVAEHVRGGRPS